MGYSTIINWSYNRICYACLFMVKLSFDMAYVSMYDPMKFMTRFFKMKKKYRIETQVLFFS